MNDQPRNAVWSPISALTRGNGARPAPTQRRVVLGLSYGVE